MSYVARFVLSTGSKRPDDFREAFERLEDHEDMIFPAAAPELIQGPGVQLYLQTAR